MSMPTNMYFYSQVLQSYSSYSYIMYSTVLYNSYSCMHTHVPTAYTNKDGDNGGQQERHEADSAGGGLYPHTEGASVGFMR